MEGAKIGEPKKTTVTIADDDEFQEILDNMMKLTNENLAGPHDHPPHPDYDLQDPHIYHHHPPQPSGLSLYQSNWGKQFANAMLVNGGDIEGASKSDYILHFLTFGLKVT